MKKAGWLSVCLGLLFALAFFPIGKNEETLIHPADSTSSINYLYNIPCDSFQVFQSVIYPGQTLSHLLSKYLSSSDIHQLVLRCRQVFNLEAIRAGHPYTLFLSKDSLQLLHFFIYEPNEFEYLVISFFPSIKIELRKRETETRLSVGQGTITSSLFETMEQHNLPVELALKMSEIFAWTIDFYRLQKNDSFLVLYEQEYVEGKPTRIKSIQAIQFWHNNHLFTAYHFVNDDSNQNADYYDQQGLSLRKAFLKAPVKFSRISSRYSLKRFHPVQKQFKPHLGTDYAAPEGTPILATGDGIITEAQYKAFNGNYVKIRHNATYVTQYLHMSKIAKGIKPGVRVKQGDVIGYVGSTGLATGPHVCYRFWKNGKQVDPLKEPLPSGEPIPPSLKKNFQMTVSRLNFTVDSLLLHRHKEHEI